MTADSNHNTRSIGTAVVGAGPAGLTAAYVLAREGAPGAVFEADAVVGGLARTLERDGYRFDLGGHRFYTKVEPIARLWEAMLGDQYLVRPRQSRIYFDGKFYMYPLVARDALRNLGVVEAARCALSYIVSHVRRHADPDTFEQWVTGRFGRRLYDKFFGPYTEKVWGVPGSEIRAEWAAQRIQNFSLAVAALSILGLHRRHVTTLIEEFHYPRLGPGQMWEAFADWTAERDVPVHLDRPCRSIRHSGGHVESIVIDSPAGPSEVPVDALISSMPLRDLVLALDPPAPPEIREAARRLRYRHLCVIALMTDGDQPFPDNWIYLHDAGVRAGRVQNFGAWSESMVPRGTCLGVEYFCFEDDELWNMDEREAVRFATDEMARIGLVDPTLVRDGAKIDVLNAYPMYVDGYDGSVDEIRDHLAGLDNLQTCGRNGLHRYNNQDHSMLTGAYAAMNVLHGTGLDVWSVNAEAEYLEEGSPLTRLAGGLELEPLPVVVPQPARVSGPPPVSELA